MGTAAHSPWKLWEKVKNMQPSRAGGEELGYFVVQGEMVLSLDRASCLSFGESPRQRDADRAGLRVSAGGGSEVPGHML